MSIKLKQIVIIINNKQKIGDFNERHLKQKKM